MCGTENISGSTPNNGSEASATAAAPTAMAEDAPAAAEPVVYAPVGSQLLDPPTSTRKCFLVRTLLHCTNYSNTNWSRTVKAASFFTTPSPSSGAAPCTVRWSCWIDAQTAEEDDLMYPPFEDEDEDEDEGVGGCFASH